MLCCRSAEVIGDGDGEGISAVEVGSWCVGPGTGGSIDGSGAIAGVCRDSEIGVVGETLGIGGREGASDWITVFFTAATGVTGDGAGDTGSVNQAEVAFRPGVVRESNLIQVGAAAGCGGGDIGHGDR